MYRKVLRQYLGISFAYNFSLSFFFATYAIFLLANDLDLLQIGIINAVFMISGLLLEIPTGAFADTLGRKFSFVLACALIALSALVYFFSNSFWYFILAELIAALGMAFHSGAWEAWAVDSLNHHGNGHSDLYNIFKKGGRYRQAGTIFGSLFGGYIGNIDLAWPWLATAISMAILTVYSFFFLKEEYFKKQEDRINWWTAFKDVIRQSLKYGVKKKQVFWLIALSSLMLIGLMSLNMYWNIFFQEEFQIRPGQLGWIFVAISLSALAGNELSYRLVKKAKGEWIALLISNIIIALGLIAAGIFNPFWLILFFVLSHETGRGSFETLSQGYLHHRLPQQQRATISSFKSMVNGIGSFIGLLVMGYVAKNYSIPFAWILSGFLIALSLPFYVKLKNGK